jgi:hypothetical protein
MRMNGQSSSLPGQSPWPLHGQPGLIARAMPLHEQMPELSTGYTRAKEGFAGAKPLHGHFFPRASLGPADARQGARPPRGGVEGGNPQPPFKKLQNTF